MTKPNQFNRRRFLFGTAQLTLGAALGSTGKLAMADGLKEQTDMKPFSILQGITTEHSTQLTIDAPQGLELSFFLLDTTEAQVLNSAHRRVEHLSATPWSIHFVKFEGLQPRRKYLFHVIDKDGNILDERELYALDRHIKNPRIAFVSCARDIHENRQIWSQVINSRPDLLVFMGDNVYGDQYGEWGPDVLNIRYVEARSRIHFYRQRLLIPTIATWDDHDYGKNNDCSQYRYKESSLASFNYFNPRDEINGIFTRGPGVASCYEAFGIQFLMLDDRYFRSPNDDRRGRMFGEEQMLWATKKVAGFQGVTWIVSGNQFFGSVSHSESLEGTFFRDFGNFMDAMRSTRRRVLFASGDIHNSETMTIERDYLGYETYELTSSGIHSTEIPIGQGNHRRRQFATRQNFVEVGVTPTNDRLLLNMRSINKEGAILFRDRMALTLG